MSRKSAKSLRVVAVVVALLFWNPITRQLVLLVLPLGSGVDDVVFMASVLAMIPLFMILRSKEPGITPIKKRQLTFWWIIAAAIIVVTIVAVLFIH